MIARSKGAALVGLASVGSALMSNHLDCHAFTIAPATRHHDLRRRGRRRRSHLSPAPSMASPTSNGDTNNHRIDRTPRDVLVIGGGLAGLSAALRIATRSDRHVTLLERETPERQRTKTVAGSFAAAGMLAPQSERLPAGPLLDICLRSREMYGEWVKGVERGAREASLGVKNVKGGRDREQMYTGEGAKYLWELTDDDGVLNSFDGGPSPPLEPWETGFHSTGGFLAPAFAGDAVATWSPQPDSGKSYWLDDVQVRELEPRLHPDVVGGWWFPEDASVDARRLTCSLRAACVGAGVHMRFGEEWGVKSLEMNAGTCEGVHLANGKVYTPKAVVVANGSWMRHLLPLPVTPHKGQSFSLRMPPNSPPVLSRVLFAQDTYIVPKADGRIIVGATVEPGRYDGDVTPEGMMHCLSEATRLIPSLGELPIEETWAGLRPTTPDKRPIIGATEQWDNIYLAGGYWRNGVLLAPKTGQLIGDLIMNDGDMEKMTEGDRALLEAFSWERFTTPGGGKALAANSRYAATFYPVHKRSTDGVAVSVGTELGFYEGAAAARGDREKDRKAMFGVSSEEEEALERAAGLGRGDAQAFSFGDEGDGWMVQKQGEGAEEDDAEESANGVRLTETVAAEAVPDAFTVGAKEERQEDATNEPIVSSENNGSIPLDLPSIYEKIKANKAKAFESITMGDDPTEERPDPGFRIYHVNRTTRETTMVPPFTSPGEFFEMKDEGKIPVVSSGEDDSSGGAVPSPSSSGEGGGGDEPLFDGYTAIREAYGEGTTAEATAEATRAARMRNRVKTSEIDESKIGAMVMPVGSSSSSAGPSSNENSPMPDVTSVSDLSLVYERIRSNKALANHNIEMCKYGEEDKPDLGFTIYHVDGDTREVREVPQYTSPGEFLDSIEREKAGDKVAVNGAKVPKPAVPAVAATDLVGEANKGETAVSTMDPLLETVDDDLMDDGSDEKTYDGYQAIQSANAAPSREEELARMKEARMKNRAKSSGGVA